MKKRMICLTIASCALPMILLLAVSNKEMLRTHTRSGVTSEVDQLQKELLLEIKKLGVNVHTDFSYYQDEEKYLHVHINGSDYIKLKEILRLVSMLPQPPLEIIIRSGCIDNDIVIFLQKIDPKRLRFWDCFFDENTATPYMESSKLEWLNTSQCKFSSRFYELFTKSHLSKIYVVEHDQRVSSAPKPQVSDAISGENSEVEQTDTKQSID